MQGARLGALLAAEVEVLPVPCVPADHVVLRRHGVRVVAVELARLRAA